MIWIGKKVIAIDFPQHLSASLLLLVQFSLIFDSQSDYVDFFLPSPVLLVCRLMKNAWLTEECLIVIHTSTPSFLVCRVCLGALSLRPFRGQPTQACSPDGRFDNSQKCTENQFPLNYFFTLASLLPWILETLFSSFTFLNTQRNFFNFISPLPIQLSQRNQKDQ